MTDPATDKANTPQVPPSRPDRGATIGAPRLMRRLMRDFARPHWPKLVISVLCGAVAALSTSANAILVKYVLDDAFKENAAFQTLYLIAGAAVTLAVVKGIAGYFQTVLMTTVGQRVVADIQNRLFGRLVHADLAFFQATPSGQLISRFTTDANQLRFASTQVFTVLGQQALTLIGLLANMFYQDWLLAIVAFFVFPVAIIPVRRMSRRMRKVSLNFQDEMGHFNALLSQVFQGARHVKAYGMEAHETARAEMLTEKIYRLFERASRVRSAASPLMESLGGVGVALVILYGGWQVTHGARTAGDFVSFVMSLLLAYQPFKQLSSLNVTIQEGMAAAQRIFELIDIEPAIRDRPGARPLVVREGTIRLEKVSFSYGTGEPVLNGIDLDIPAGRKVALVGPSGAGKSTVLNLIPRFYDVGAGCLTIDGQDVRDATLTSLRGAIGLVSQEVSLFDDTVRANIAYGRPDADEAAIVAAAKSAAAHDFILDLPNGYDTIVGELGTRLSGGQRQRLSIARAMLKNAPILLLDEATSALDTESERQVQDALKLLMAGRTSVVIAHRLSTIVDADLIYAIDGGQVVEVGRHQELLQRQGVYARLWAMQFAEQDPVPDGLLAEVRG
ncbi:MAG TPA: ABC transporter ATP-binding protein [Aliidongia sp.]|uniref:ABC transporter ATP-binding protein n=1 Tax=Aliidongia sp. TaxID=1914230 RepID=UPI002DDCFE1B|nr:ABC transporter ATP-binding protein [Aliidongia sp.]HEV2676541.1 ABC transporter ATP-binding protein [Aliidongia sp.]